jgi:outer membrane PBP1 activator LpoA protein
MTSLAYTAGAKEANEDLEGATLPGMPWLLPDASLDAVRSAAQQSGASWQSQYFAFGYDACQLALAVAGSPRDLARVRVAGLTGQLTIDGGGHVRRAQLWARIRGGEAQLLPDVARN